jgi:hypothetical protein
MIRIIGVQRESSPSREFVLLQNQGSLRINLRGHVILSEQAIDLGELSNHFHVFSDEALVPPGMYVMLCTGHGTPRWAKTKEGALIFYAFMNRDYTMWDNSEMPLHILSLQHTFVARKDAVVVG